LARPGYVLIIKRMSIKSNMRFHSPLDEILGNPIRVKLLRVLTRRSGVGFTGRELARICGASPSQTNASLKEFEASGLLTREISGRSHVWRLSQEHILSQPLARLFIEEAGSLTELKSELEKLIRQLPIEQATLFGSLARGDERPTSDVDLLVTVRNRIDKEAVEEALNAASFSFLVKFGNPLSPLVLESSRRGDSLNPELLRHVREEGVQLETGK
jgi:predicted nucleotidyltransferase